MMLFRTSTTLQKGSREGHRSIHTQNRCKKFTINPSNSIGIAMGNKSFRIWRKQFIGLYFLLGIGIFFQIGCGGSNASATNTTPVAKPANLTYKNNPAIYTKGTPIPANIPALSGGAPTLFLASPSLPSGLNLDTKTGAITGTPSEISGNTAYTLSASNSAGTASCILEIRVQDAAPKAEIHARDEVFCNEGGIQASVPPQRGMTVHWTLTSGTAAPVIASEVTNNVITYNSGPTSGTYQLSVSVENQTGEIATNSRTLKVVNEKFLPDIRSPHQRQGHTATLLAGGRLLVVGGIEREDSSTSTYKPMATAEVFDPSTNTWVDAGHLSTARYGHAATLLANGNVLVTGGWFSGPVLASGEIYNPTSNTWYPAATMSTARTNHTATLLLSGKVLIVGGSSSTPGSAELYDPELNTWTRVGSIAAGSSSHTATLLRNGKVLVAGGASGVPCMLFDPDSNSWAEAGSMVNSPIGHAATLLPNGNVLAVGGSLIHAEIFDFKKNQWSAAADMSYGRAGHTATLLNSGKVLVTGGYRDGNPSQTFPEIYDPASNTWSSAGVMLTQRGEHTATLLEDGTVLAVGGTKGIGYTGPLASPEIYDPNSNTWIHSGGLVFARLGFTVTQLSDGKVLVAGGKEGRNSMASAEVYDPRSRLWFPAGNMSTPRAFHTATRLRNGTVLVTGGEKTLEQSGTSSIEVLASSELYDPASNSWSSAAALGEPREYHTATLMPNGQVLVAGGMDMYYSSRTTELYDPDLKAWKGAGAMNSRRDFHTATLLSDGKLLVTGGQIDFAVVEAYDPESDLWAPRTQPHETLEGPATLLRDGRVMALGHIYDPSTDTWGEMGSGAISLRTFPTATLLSDGRVIAIGGRGAYDIALDSAEVYDPSSNVWLLTDNMPSARTSHQATLLPDGTIMVLGGYPSYTPLFWKP